MSEVLPKRTLVGGVDHRGPAKDKNAGKQTENTDHYCPIMQDFPAVGQEIGMAYLPQSEEVEQYDQKEIQTDQYTQEREISIIESFGPCVHVNIALDSL
jgi:hypothetical protein